MASRQTIKLPHLGLEAGYALSNNTYDATKPTCVLINSMCTTTSLYREQLGDKRLTSVMNLLAIDPLGHGSTSCLAEHFTYWDTAMMALQVLNELGIEKAFALGTSQGGWIVTRMALLEPGRVSGKPTAPGGCVGTRLNSAGGPSATGFSFRTRGPGPPAGHARVMAGANGDYYRSKAF